ncbi:MAG: acetylglutamate kinase [Phycisphaerales bacterium]|nr:acetylglutamate kinase [Phycisphaerales bacterium]
MTARPLIVKIGGAAVDAPEQTGALWAALAALHRAEPGGVIVVHGGGNQVDAHLSRLGLSSQRVAGLRVTPDDQIGEVVAVLRGRVNTAVVGALAAHGARAVGLGLGDGGLARCARHTPDGIDLGRVGAVEGGDAAVLHALLAGGFMPVICSIGLDAAGAPLNVNADDAAAAIAPIAAARALLLLTDVEGLLDADRRLVRQTTAEGVERLIATGVIVGGMIPKTRAALRAVGLAGVPTVIASWKTPEALAALARGEVAGTRILPSHAAPAPKGHA